MSREQDIASVQNRELKKLKRRALLEAAFWLPLTGLGIWQGDWFVLVYVLVIYLFIFRNYMTETFVVRYRTLLDEVFKTVGEMEMSNKPAKKAKA